MSYTSYTSSTGITYTRGAKAAPSANGVESSVAGVPTLTVSTPVLASTTAAGLEADLGYLVLPAGRRVVAAYVKVTSAFTGTGDLDLGTAGSEATNGLTVPVLNVLDTVGTHKLGENSIALIGTWAAELTAATTVGAGLSASLSAAGEAEIILELV
jgi:hypothetical protein